MVIYRRSIYPNADVRNPGFQEDVHNPFRQEPLRTILQMLTYASAMFPAAVDLTVLPVYIKSTGSPSLVADDT
jgi:hypothetical protein